MRLRNWALILFLGISAYAGTEESTSQSRTVRFPGDFSLGRLRIRDRGSQRWQDWKDYGFARGDVQVPENKELQLTVVFEAFDRRSSLSSLEPDDIQELHISSRDLTDADLIHIRGLTGLEALFFGGTYAGPCPLADEGLMNLQSMTKLRSLMLDFTSITDDGLAHLKSLKSLEELRLHRNKQVTGDGLVHLENLSSLRELVLYATPIEDDGLKYIRQLNSLEVLSLQSTQVTDAGLAHLKDLSSLKELLLPRQITDDGLAHLEGLTSLERLLIYSEDITDVGLAHLKNLASLKSLTLFSAQITDTAVEQLAKDLPDLDISISLHLQDDVEMGRLRGSSCVTSLSVARSQVTEVGFANIKGLTSLKYLNASRTMITDAGFAHLQGLHALNNLDLNDSQITDVGLAHVKGLSALDTLRLRNTGTTDAGLVYLKDLKALKMLFLTNTQVSDAGLVHLRDLTSLTVLFLRQTNVTGSGLTHLKRLKSLRHLDLSGTPLTDEAAEHLAEMTWLRTLSVNTAGISEETLQQLRQALPDCSLRLSKEQVVPRTQQPKPTPAELVSLYKQAVTSWDRSVAMHVELVHSMAKRGTDETDIRNWRYDVTHRRDGDRCEWFGRCQFKGEHDGEDYSFNEQFTNIVGDDFFLYYTKRHLGEQPSVMTQAIMGSNIKEKLFILQAQEPDGGFLQGRMGGIGIAPKMVDVMSDSNSLNLVGQETLSGSFCYIIEAKTKYGTFTVWIAPEKGYNALKYVVRKSGRDILRDDIRTEDQGITEWVEVVDSIDVQKIDGVFVPISGKLTSKARGGDDWENTDHVEVKRSEIVLNPDFKALGAFEISFPEGTEVSHQDIPGLRFRWTNGKFVPDMNTYLIKNLAGKPLPSFDRIMTGFDPEGAAGKMVLVCFFDMNQRPSRNCIMQLAKQAEQLKQKGVTVVAVQASKVDEKKLNEWVVRNNIHFPVGIVQGSEEKTCYAWGVRSLPWLILTNRKHEVLAEGLGLDQIKSKIQGAGDVNL